MTRTCVVCAADLDALGKNKKAIYCSIRCKQKALYTKNPSVYANKNRVYYQTHRDKVLNRMQRNYRALSEELRKHTLCVKRNSYHRLKIDGRYIKKAAARRAMKLQRTPAWADLERIKAYYDVCAFFNDVNGYAKYHVDHVVPLQGKNVSGLHVHNNLQVILAEENKAKGNKFDHTSKK